MICPDDMRGCDTQAERPVKFCAQCGGEIYEGERIFDLNHWLCGRYEKWVCFEHMKEYYHELIERFTPEQFAAYTNTPMKIAGVDR